MLNNSAFSIAICVQGDLVSFYSVYGSVYERALPMEARGVETLELELQVLVGCPTI